MDKTELEKYNKQREDIIRDCKRKKLINAVSVLGIGAVLVLIVVLLNGVLFNIAVTLVLSAMIIMISIIFMRIRIVTINHIMQTRLMKFENNY